MKYPDSHVHTKHFSGDATADIESLVFFAQSMNVPSVVISEHFDEDLPHEMPYPMIFDPKTFFDTFESWQDKYKNRVDLRAGIELGYQAHLIEKYIGIVKSYPFSSIILSNHLVYGQDPYYFTDCYDVGQNEIHSQYIRDLIETVQSGIDFDVLGHFDYIVRNAPYENPKMLYDHCPDEFDTLFRTLIEKDKSLEINTRTVVKMIHKGVSEPLPDTRIIKRYIDLGGTKVTLGSDSHAADTLGVHFNEVAKMLCELGLCQNTSYVNRQAQTHVFE